MAAEGKIFGQDLEVSFERLKQNLAKRGKSRLLWQFRKSPVLNQIIEQMSKQMQDAYDAAIQCLEKRTLAKAEGVNLDTIGRIVGQDRLWDDIEYYDYFTPDSGDLCADKVPVWVKNAPLVGYLMAQDTNYRKMILAKIFKNHSMAGSQPENMYCAQFVSNEVISFVKTGLQQYKMAFAYGTNIEIITLLLRLWRNEQIDQFYFLPIPATVYLDTQAVFLLPTENGYSIGFAPDKYDTRPDHAKAAISTQIGEYV